MELKDKVRITLTRSGAKFLVERAIREKKKAVRYSLLSQREIEELYHINYHEDMVLRAQLHEVFSMFRWFIHPEDDPPFINLELDDDKRCSCSKSLRLGQAA